MCPYTTNIKQMKILCKIIDNSDLSILLFDEKSVIGFCLLCAADCFAGYSTANAQDTY